MLRIFCFFEGGSRSLGVFVLAYVAIITAIMFSLVVGKSITTMTDTGSVELLFDYPMNIYMDANHVATQSLGSISYGATWVFWLTNSAANLTSLANETFSGTFIIQDSQPFGQQISGSVSCVDPSDSLIVNMTGFDDTGILNITYLPDYKHNISGSLTLDLDLDHIYLAIGKLTGQYLPSIDNFNFDQNATFIMIWFTITDGIIPNAMEVPQSLLKLTSTT